MYRLIIAIVLAALAGAAHAQERFSLFVGSDINDVRHMLEVAALRDGDVVYDLGSGDGRIVLEAARMNRAVRGRGIEIDEKLVRESTATAQEQGIADRVQFLHQNAFDADLKSATVITMWLYPELMRLLRTKILAEAVAGTRVLTRIWDLGNWKADYAEDAWPLVSMWIVPARVGGNWTWQLVIDDVRHDYGAVVEQRFQEAEGVVRSGNRRGILEKMFLSGDKISFALTMTVGDKSPVIHQFSGRVKGDVIEGMVSMLYKPNEQPIELPWRAVRVKESNYFAPTGVTLD